MSDWSVVVPGAADAAVPRLLADEYGLTVLASPDLYDLPAGHPVFSAIDETPGPVAVAAPYLPRATYWILAAGGVTGRRADVADTKTTGKLLHPIDLSDCDDDAAVERIVAVTGRGDGDGVVRDFWEELPPRWYPVIDYDRCTHCLQCVEFCLFGVFELRSDRSVYVAIADNCKTGCPACSRVCPAGAILFPRYPHGGPIAGADEGRPEQLDGNEARRAGIPEMKAYIARYGDPDKIDAPRGELDEIIDDLERFEP